MSDDALQILQAAAAGELHPGVERVLRRLHPDQVGGPMGRDWIDALQAAEGRLVGRFDVAERPARGEPATAPQWLRPNGPQGSDGFEQLTLVDGDPVLRWVARDKALVLSGRAEPTLVPYDAVRERWERARVVDAAPDSVGGPGEVIRGP